MERLQDVIKQKYDGELLVIVRQSNQD